MTVSREISSERQQGNGVTTIFTYNIFLLPNQLGTADVTVRTIDRATDQVITTLVFGGGGADGYTATYNEDTEQITVTVNTAPLSTEDLQLLRNTSITQETDLPIAGRFPSVDVENALDRLTVNVQEVNEAVGRSVKVPDTVTGDVLLPTYSPNDVLAWSATEANVLVNQSGVPAVIGDNQIVTSNIADGQITEPKLADNAVTVPKIDADVFYAHKNRIINGDMAISQRGTSFVSPADASYVLDRYVWNKSGVGEVTITQDTDVPTVAQAGRLLIRSLEIDVTTADTSIAAGDLYLISQRIEGHNFRSLAQKSFTLSFWVKATKTGIYSVGFRNDGLDRSYVAEYTVNSTDTWEFKTVTVSASPSAGTWNYTNGIGLRVNFALGVGSTFSTGTIGSWQAGNFFSSTNQVNAVDSTANNFFITGVQIEAGENATPFEERLQGAELVLAQRYYFYLQRAVRNFSSASSGGQNTEQTIFLPTTMRATPTATQVFSSNVNNNFNDIINLGPDGFQIRAQSASSGVYGSFYDAGNNLSAEL